MLRAFSTRQQVYVDPENENQLKVRPKRLPYTGPTFFEKWSSMWQDDLKLPSIFGFMDTGRESWLRSLLECACFSLCVSSFVAICSLLHFAVEKYGFLKHGYANLNFNETASMLDVLYGVVGDHEIPASWWATLSTLLLIVAVFWPIYIRQRTRRLTFRIEGNILPRLVVTLHHLDFVKTIWDEKKDDSLDGISEEDDESDEEDGGEEEKQQQQQVNVETSELQQNQKKFTPVLKIGTLAQLNTNETFPDKTIRHFLSDSARRHCSMVARLHHRWNRKIFRTRHKTFAYDPFIRFFGNYSKHRTIFKEQMRNIVTALAADGFMATNVGMPVVQHQYVVALIADPFAKAERTQGAFRVLLIRRDHLGSISEMAACGKTPNFRKMARCNGATTAQAIAGSKFYKRRWKSLVELDALVGTDDYETRMISLVELTFRDYRGEIVSSTDEGGGGDYRTEAEKQAEWDAYAGPSLSTTTTTTTTQREVRKNPGLATPLPALSARGKFAPLGAPPSWNK